MVDLIHAHYVLSGWTAVLSRPRVPIVLSLMGTDCYGEYIGPRIVRLQSRYLTLLTYCIQPFVNFIISKSANIDRFVYVKNKTKIIPNGVNLDQFTLYGDECREELSLDRYKRYILFLGNTKNKRKNYKLGRQAYRLLNDPQVELIAPYPVSHDRVVKYLNTVDVILSTSLMEGSPNIIKESMACNCPLVATDVGDVKWLVGNIPGCYVSTFDAEDVAGKIKMALLFGRRTEGRKRLIELGLDSASVAKKIIEVYEQTVSKK